MPLTPNFSMSQNSGTPNIITATDTSTGSNVTITGRRIYLLQSDGTYLVPSGTTTNYVVWALADTSISLNVLTQDTALTVTVDWVDINGTTVETKTISFGFTAYNETFYYGLTQGQVAITNPLVQNSTGYYSNKMLLRVFIDSGDQAISFASDIYSAQLCYDNATYLVTNASFNF